MCQMIAMMVFISVVTIPVLMIYASYSGLTDTSMAVINQFSLGNMGGSGTACSQAPLDIDNATLMLTCPTGEINTAAVTETGLFALTAGIIN